VAPVEPDLPSSTVGFEASCPFPVSGGIVIAWPGPLAVSKFEIVLDGFDPLRAVKAVVSLTDALLSYEPRLPEQLKRPIGMLPVLSATLYVADALHVVDVPFSENVIVSL